MATYKDHLICQVHSRWMRFDIRHSSPTASKAILVLTRAFPHVKHGHVDAAVPPVYTALTQDQNG